MTVGGRAAVVFPRDLTPGVPVLYCDVAVTVLEAPRPCTDPFGGDGCIEVLARREDTGREGFMRFGPDAEPLAVDTTRDVADLGAEAAAADPAVPPHGGWTFVPQEVFDPCAGGHVPHTYLDDDGSMRCNRCGRAIDSTPCGCGAAGHEHLARSYCQQAIHRDQRAVALRAR